jgi:hypothetical protein
LATQFHMYLRYVHHLDITLVDGHGIPDQIQKVWVASSKEDNKNQAGGATDSPQVL